MKKIGNPKKLRVFDDKEVMKLAPLLSYVYDKYKENRENLIRIFYFKKNTEEEKKALSIEIKKLDENYVEKIGRLGGRVMMERYIIRFEAKDGFIFWNIKDKSMEKLKW